jgi:hypothetical protein
VRWGLAAGSRRQTALPTQQRKDLVALACAYSSRHSDQYASGSASTAANSGRKCAVLASQSLASKGAENRRRSSVLSQQHNLRAVYATLQGRQVLADLSRLHSLASNTALNNVPPVS